MSFSVLPEPTPASELRGPGRARPGAGNGVRIEIQALRAGAVLLVLLYHLWPDRLTGGYVGVDMFFAISGFLITAHLLREVARSGTVWLPAFWARRARRLLPASLLVLAVAGVTTIALVPDSHWQQYLTEIGASALYVENWTLASNSVDYLAAGNAASPVQHFWSLSAEEQFYLVWPILILGALMISRAFARRFRLTVVAVTLAVVTLASLVVSIVWTSQVPASAYFVTPTRMWEFGAGGLLAVGAARPSTLPAPLRAVVSWAGIAAIGTAAITLTGASAFPGVLAALPVLGTLAVIWAGDPRLAWSPTRIGGLRPIQFLGDVSYSLYLWHWPLIVFVPFALGRALSATDKLVILVASVTLAYVTKIAVEDPFRFSNPLVHARPRWTFVAVTTAAVVAVVGCGAGLTVLDHRNAREAARILAATEQPCFGAAAIDPANSRPDKFSAAGAMTPAFARTDTDLLADPAGGWKCEVPRGAREIRTCRLGTATNPERTLAMLGDSHAMQFMAPMKVIAERNDWQVVTYFKSGCSGTQAGDVLQAERPDDQAACAAWGADAIAAIANSPEIDSVIFSNQSVGYLQDNGAGPIGPQRYQAAWDRLTAAGKKVFVIADVPRTSGDTPDCLASAGTDLRACDTVQTESTPADAMAQAAISSPADAVTLIDLTSSYCAHGVCHARIGGVVVYSDSSHLTKTYARSLAPYLESALLVG